MSGLTIYHLRFTFTASERIEFGIQAGTQIRGALYDALRRELCAAPSGHHDPVGAELCPVCWLMAREDPDAIRGKDIPRAFTVQPPDERVYTANQTFTLGLTLFGRAIALFPHIVLALPAMGTQGIGFGRGRFHLESIEAVHPLSGEIELLMPPGTRIVRRPTLTITHEQIKEKALLLSPDHLKLRFLTPTRLTENRVLVKSPLFRTLLSRLLERLDTLEKEYGEGCPSPWQELTALAANITLVRDDTHWIEVHSGSRRTGTLTPISGFVGEAVYEGDLTPFREWLLWGQSIQIGKDTVKGNGLFKIVM